MKETLRYTPESIRDPRNHPRRIFVSCHPDDLEKFDEICEMIRKIEPDCVIAHRLADAEKEDFDPEEISDFHLIVIPVTEKWFDGDGGFHDEEFRFVTERNKSVLPLLFDEGVGKRFNDETENLQYLRVGDGEFDEKLKRALSEILIDSKMIKEVEKVFSHRMFISYCKEDLKHTQELIRCIHKGEAGRRIAVWYDKYLPTGRNFLDSIFRELDDCHIFAMTVTPSIVSRTNFVETEEYPRAVRKKKEIRLFEMLPTESDRLKNKFHGVEKYDLRKVSRDGGFEGYVRKILKSTEGIKHDLPKDEADYRLGLAYLNGIFVEFDGKYALKKLESAANAGNTRAAEELALTHLHGKGVPRNPRLAGHWIKIAARLAEKDYRRRKEAFRSSPQSRTPRFPNTRDDEYYQAMADYGNETVRLIGVLNRGARILRDNGDTSDAVEFYEKALDILEEADHLAAPLEIGKTYRGVIEGEFGIFGLVRGRHEPAKEPWERAFAAFLEEPEDYPKALGTVNCGRVYGVELLQDGKPAEGREILTEALKIAEAYADDQRFCETRLPLLRDIGLSYLLEGNVTEARERLTEAGELYDNFPFDKKTNPYLFFFLPKLRLHFGECAFREGNYEESIKEFLLSLVYLKELEKELGDRKFTDDYPVSFLQHYGFVAEKLMNFQTEAPVPICRHLKEVLDTFGGLEYRGIHKDQAQHYIRTILRTILHLSGE